MIITNYFINECKNVPLLEVQYHIAKTIWKCAFLNKEYMDRQLEGAKKHNGFNNYEDDDKKRVYTLSKFIYPNYVKFIEEEMFLIPSCVSIYVSSLTEIMKLKESGLLYSDWEFKNSLIPIIDMSKKTKSKNEVVHYLDNKEFKMVNICDEQIYINIEKILDVFSIVYIVMDDRTSSITRFVDEYIIIT